MPVYGFPFLRRVSSAASACHLRPAKELSCRGAWIPLRAGFGRLPGGSGRVATHGSERFLGLCVLCVRGRLRCTVRLFRRTNYAAVVAIFVKIIDMQYVSRTNRRVSESGVGNVQSDPIGRPVPVSRLIGPRRFFFSDWLRKVRPPFVKSRNPLPDQRSADDQEPDPCRRRGFFRAFPRVPVDQAERIVQYGVPVAVVEFVQRERNDMIGYHAPSVREFFRITGPYRIPSSINGVLILICECGKSVSANFSAVM